MSRAHPAKDGNHIQNLSLRRASESDLPHIDALYNAGLATEIQGPPEMEKHFVRMPAGTTCLAEIDGYPVGFVNYNGQDLRYIYVHPDYHGFGIGSLLIDKALADIGPEARLLVYTHNEKAQRLYLSRGFTPVADAHANGLSVFVRKQDAQS